MTPTANQLQQHDPAKLADLVAKAASMRAAQQWYFRSRLHDAKRKEREFDEALATLKEREFDEALATLVSPPAEEPAAQLVMFGTGGKVGIVK